MKDEDKDYHRSDEQVNVVIESQPGCSLKSVKKKYIRCSAHTTVTHLKKFIAKKLYNNLDKYKDVSTLDPVQVNPFILLFLIQITVANYQSD